MGLGAHLVLTIGCFAVGACFWLFDDFFAERHEVDQDFHYGTFGLNEPERDQLGRDAYRERHSKSARYVGYAFMGVAVISALVLVLRLIL